MFLGSDRGGKAAAIHYTLMASCKANEVEPFAYIRDVLNHLPSLLRSKERIDTPSGTKAKTTTETAEWLTPWLPDEWLKSNPQFHRHRSR